jgi:hypothetical protein
MNMMIGMSLFLSSMGMICLGSNLNADNPGAPASTPADQQTSQQETNPDMTSSAASALQWLGLIDKGQYDQSWQSGAKLFQQTMPEKEWSTYLDGVRKPLGSVSSRQVIDQRPAKNPNGLPEGDYMVLFYNTAFSSKPSAYELVTMMKESDGQWRVLTYQVQ